MANGILPPELKSIEALLTGDARFFVPKYQRSFAWESDEIEELWDDIREAVENQRQDYFLGTIVLQSSKPGLYEIIDGQQRLACISMIFSAIRNVFEAKNDPKRAERVFTSFLGARDFSSQSLPKPKLELNRINNQTFVQYVIASVDQDTVTEALRDKSLPKSNRDLLIAYKFFLDKISDEVAHRGTKSDEFLVPLINCLRSSVKLITIPVTSEEDANLFFESLNARGKELAVSDLVKNRLYFEARDDVERAQQLWEKMETELARRSIPEYLRHYWIAKKADKTSLTVREKKLYGAIAKEVKGHGETEIINLLEDLASTARDYAMITDDTLWPDDNAYDKSFEESLSDLAMFRISQCNPLLLNAIQVFKDPTKIAKTFRIIANFAFRYNIIGNGSPGAMERIFGELAFGVRTGTYTSPRSVADQLRAVNSDAKFRADFELATVSEKKAKIARYLLGKINNHASGKENIVNPDAKDINLDHILPQKPNRAWISAFSKGIDYKDYIYRIGNLTLLSRKIQKEEEVNKSFKNKQELALKTSGLQINAYLKQVTTWSEVEIEHRQKKMAQVALEIWNL